MGWGLIIMGWQPCYYYGMAAYYGMGASIRGYGPYYGMEACLLWDGGLHYGMWALLWDGTLLIITGCCPVYYGMAAYLVLWDGGIHYGIWAL